MVTISRQLGRAMAAQVERVNNDPDRLQELLQEARDTIANMRQLLQSKDATIFDLEDRLRAAGSAVQRITADAPQTYNGRPVITPAQAAQRVACSRSTVNRYLSSGHWEGVQLPGSNRWLVYADQPLTNKQSKKSRKTTK